MTASARWAGGSSNSRPSLTTLRSKPLPSAAVDRKPDGAVTVDFDRGSVVIEGVPTSAATSGADIEGEGFRVTSVAVNIGSDPT